jgi:hypothetical protein
MTDQGFGQLISLNCQITILKWVSQQAKSRELHLTPLHEYQQLPPIREHKHKPTRRCHAKYTTSRSEIESFQPLRKTVRSDNPGMERANGQTNHNC